MKYNNMKWKVGLLIILCVLFSNILSYVPSHANSSQVVIFKEDENNSYYENLSIESVLKDDIYYAVVIMEYNDSTYNHVILTSSDSKKWQYLDKLSEKSAIIPEKLSIRLLNNVFVVSTSFKNGNVKYISNDAIQWEEVQLQYEDLLYYSDLYWALDSKGTVFTSEDLIHWNLYVTLDSSNKEQIIAVNLCVNDNVIIVSHYSPKWGSANYKNGLEVYDKKQKVWKETTGYKGVYGTSIEIVNLGEQFVLTYQNDYAYDGSILYYTSYDGITWSLNDNKTDMLRKIKGLTGQDSNTYKLVDLTKNLIEINAINGGYTQVQLMLDNQVIQFDQDPLLVKGRVLVPVRKIFESLGGTVEYNQETKELLGIIGDKTIKLTLGEKVATVNGEAITLDVPAQIISNRVFVPVRFLAECIGKKVEWDQENYVISLEEAN